MKRNYRNYAFVLLISGLLLSGCAVRPMVPTTTIGSIGSRERLLIATQTSEFKDGVVSNVTQEFEKAGLFIEITDLENLENRSCRDYQAIIIMNEYKAFRNDSRVTRFMEGVDAGDTKKIVLLTTAGAPGMIPEKWDVDAISAASEMAEVDSVSRLIIRKVHMILTSE